MGGRVVNKSKQRYKYFPNSTVLEWKTFVRGGKKRVLQNFC